MTPEQKAFFEFGGAWEHVVLTHKGIRSTVKELPGKNRQKLLRQARNETHQNELVLNAWQKRAACRAWVPLAQRECRDCHYGASLISLKTCRDCTPGIHLVDFCNWKPRKEDE